MKCSKKMLSIVAILLVISVGIALPVKADTYVDVDTTGNVQVVINTDGTVSLFYNGVNIQAEINGLYSALSGIALRMNTLATKTDVGNLNQTVYQLIVELDGILGDLFGGTNFLASVIGISSNSSVVVENLLVGTQTVASYLDSVLTTLDDVADDVEVLEGTIDGVQERFNVLEAFETQVLEQFNATENEIEDLTDYTEEQRNLIRLQITALEKDIEAFVDTKALELNQQREALRETILTDLLTLDTSVQELASLVQDEKDRQAITEKEVQNLQNRLDEAEKTFNTFIIAVIITAIAVGCVVVFSKLQKKPKIRQ